MGHMHMYIASANAQTNLNIYIYIYNTHAHAHCWNKLAACTQAKIKYSGLDRGVWLKRPILRITISGADSDPHIMFLHGD